MNESIMLQASLSNIAKPLSSFDKYSFRGFKLDDSQEVGRLYFYSYEKGQACKDEASSIQDVINSFNGEYGVLFRPASLVVEYQGSIVRAILVVEQNSWDNEVNCPYIIELFVDKLHRKKYLAKNLILKSCNELKRSNFKKVALTVVKNNIPARNLYTKIGFSQER